MPRKADSDSEEEVKKSTMKTKRSSKAEVDAEEDVNDGENVSGGDDEDDEPEYEIEAILDAKQGVFEQVRITNIHLTRFLRVVPLARDMLSHYSGAGESGLFCQVERLS